MLEDFAEFTNLRRPDGTFSQGRREILVNAFLKAPLEQLQTLLFFRAAAARLVHDSQLNELTHNRLKSMDHIGKLSRAFLLGESPLAASIQMS